MDVVGHIIDNIGAGIFDLLTADADDFVAADLGGGFGGVNLRRFIAYSMSSSLSVIHM
jgi:hypothetical protein